MIKLDLSEVSPKRPQGELQFFIKDNTQIVFYYNRNPYSGSIEYNAGYFIKAESLPSYFVKVEEYWIYGSYTEIKQFLSSVV